MVTHIGIISILLKKMIDRIVCLLTAFVLVGCASQNEPVGMYPDYRGVTVPCNIAPLNFYYTGGKSQTTFSCGDYSFSLRGRDVCIPETKWKELISRAKGDSIRVSSSLMGEWSIAVSPDSIDQYLTYRLLEPAYEVANWVEIYERDLSNFNERELSSYYNTQNACMNCHIHKGDNSFFYLRGPRGGAVLSSKGALRKMTLKNSSMFSGTVYGDLHLNGRWGVFSMNVVIPSFHTQSEKRLEVYDSKSDLCIVDFDNNKLLLYPELTRADVLETFPCFSSDGLSVFYCAADSVVLPRDVKKLHYSLYRVPFDPQTGEIGAQEVVWDAKQRNGSVCHPKASPDGRWLLYTVADYGTFPIWHRECDLEMMNLNDGTIADLSAANSEWSDTYHSWSSNSRWFVFASKRDDGQYGKPYFCHVDENGVVSRAFLLPQKNPHHYDKTLKSFNIPDLGVCPAKFTVDDIGRLHQYAKNEVFE